MPVQNGLIKHLQPYFEEALKDETVIRLLWTQYALGNMDSTITTVINAKIKALTCGQEKEDKGEEE